MRKIHTFPNRTICEMLDELRKCYDTRNFSYFLGILEEIQSAANRMEAKLEDNKDAENAKEIVSEAKKELADLNREIQAKKDLKELLK